MMSVHNCNVCIGLFAAAPDAATGAADATAAAAAVAPDQAQDAQESKGTPRPVLQPEAVQDQAGASPPDGAAATAAVDPGEQAAGRVAGEGKGGAAQTSGRIPDDYICVPPPMDSEAGVSNLPTTASLVSKLREVWCLVAPRPYGP